MASIGEIIGGIAVLLTLLYLAYETRRNTTIHISATTSDAYIRWAEINDIVSVDENLAALWVRIYENESLAGFDATDRLRVNFSIRSLVQRLAAVHSQHENGLVNVDFWNKHKEWFASFLRLKGVEEWWQVEKNSSLFSDSFIQELENASGFVMSSTAQRIDEPST